MTHDQEEALSISDRVAVMNEGHVLQMAAPAAIYRQPADAFVARFIGAGGVLAGRTAGATVRIGEIALPSDAAAAMPSGTEVEMFLRPEHVSLHDARDGAPVGSVAAEVVDLTFFGSLSRIKLGLTGAPNGADAEAERFGLIFPAPPPSASCRARKSGHPGPRGRHASWRDSQNPSILGVQGGKSVPP